MIKRKFSALQVIAFGFFLIAMLGTLVLMLPVSSRDGTWTPFLTALFTAVSSSCVTGLVLVDTAVHWSLFGQIVILLLIQTGGLGFMTIATFFMSLAKKNINLRNRSIMAESINTTHIAGLKGITKKIIIGTALFEGIGAIILSIRFIGEFGIGKGIWYGIFHSISAFCNAGFDLFGVQGEFSSLINYTGDIIINMTLMILIAVGGIGFLVWDDIARNKLNFRRYQLHTKIVLVVSLALTFGGAIIILLLENNNSLEGMTLTEKILGSLFSSVTCRTAGFNTVDFAALSKGSILIMCFLMFVGGSSGSTAGGAKTTTVAVIFSYLFASLRGISKPVIFGRTIDSETHRKAVTVCVFNLTLIFSAITLICAVDNLPLEDVCFEIFSAMNTVGMTTGITRDLSVVSQLAVIILMFCGRVGSISFALAILEKRAQPAVTYPAESITVG
ncbi:MAG: Trk family potassium uptake protein [Clostridia bacterium]|nr:Trk family potassium uptake protein [Clostridia bacterium]